MATDSGTIKYTITADGKTAITEMGKVNNVANRAHHSFASAAKEAREFKKLGAEISSGNINAGELATVALKKVGMVGVAGGLLGNFVGGAVTGLIDMAFEAYSKKLEKAREETKQAIESINKNIEATTTVPSLRGGELAHLASTHPGVATTDIAKWLNEAEKGQEGITKNPKMVEAIIKTGTEAKEAGVLRPGDFTRFAENGMLAKGALSPAQVYNATSDVYSLNQLDKRVEKNASEFEQYQNTIGPRQHTINLEERKKNIREETERRKEAFISALGKNPDVAEWGKEAVRDVLNENDPSKRAEKVRDFGKPLAFWTTSPLGDREQMSKSEEGRTWMRMLETLESMDETQAKQLKELENKNQSYKVDTNGEPK